MDFLDGNGISDKAGQIETWAQDLVEKFNTKVYATQ